MSSRVRARSEQPRQIVEFKELLYSMQTNYRIIVDKTTGHPKCFAVHSEVIPETVGESSEIARAECGHRAGGPRRFSPRDPVGHRHSAQTLLIAIPAIKA